MQTKGISGDGKLHKSMAETYREEPNLERGTYPPLENKAKSQQSEWQ